MIEESIDLFFFYRTFFAGSPDSAFEFFPVVLFTGVIFFDNDQVCCAKSFEGGESVIAVFALSTPANGGVVVGESGVDYAIFYAFTSGALHWKNYKDLRTLKMRLKMPSKS